MDIVKKVFGSDDLYKIFGVSKEVADDEKALRSAYLKAALKFHPDKAPEEERESYTKKFQTIKKIYELFQGHDLKKVYDETGCWPDDDKIELDEAAFARLDVNAILEFKKMYQGSEEERQDIKKYYEKGEGDIFYICDNVFFLNILDDEDRVNAIIKGLIDAGEMKELTKGKKGAAVAEKKRKKAEKEAEEAAQMMKEKNLGGGLEDLQKAIASKNKARESFLDDLAAKYGGGSAPARNGKGKKKADTSDEEPGTKKSKASAGKATSKGSAGTRTTRSTRSAK